MRYAKKYVGTRVNISNMQKGPQPRQISPRPAPIMGTHMHHHCAYATPKLPRLVLVCVDATWPRMAGMSGLHKHCSRASVFLLDHPLPNVYRQGAQT